MNGSPDEQAMTIESGLRRMILIELVFPMVLLVLGIYHGMMQVLYRAGMIHSRQVLGLDERPVLCRQGAVTTAAFHPELSGDLRLHELFLKGA